VNHSQAKHRAPSRRRPWVPIAAGLAASVLLSGGMAEAVTPTATVVSSPPAELVVNGSFDEGTSGWRTPGTHQQLSSYVGSDGDVYGQLSASGTTTLRLNDQRNTVATSDPGVTYRVTAQVASAQPTLNGQVRVREVGPDGVRTYAAPFSLRGTGWQTVTFAFTTTQTDAQLDLNVLAWKAVAGQTLVVDDISMVAVAGTPAPAPLPTPTPTPTATPGPTATPTPAPSATPGPTATPTSAPSATPAPSPSSAPRPVQSGVAGSLSNGCVVSVRGVPACGALVGASVGSNTDPGSLESVVGGRLGVRRTFFSASGVDGAVRIAQADAAAGRVSWMSFKVPYTWAEMAAGRGDAWAADLTARLGATGGTVWVAFHHEPENDGAIGDWVAMQRRLAPVVHAAAPNVAFSMIVTGWNQFYGPSQYSMEAIWPGDGLVDVLGFDLYNTYGQVKDGVVSTETTDMGSRYFTLMQAFAAKHGVAWGLAEVAYTHASSDVDPQWMVRTYDQMAAAGGVAFAYFNTTLNNEVGDWPLAYGSKTPVFASILARSPRLN